MKREKRSRSRDRKKRSRSRGRDRDRKKRSRSRDRGRDRDRDRASKSSRWEKEKNLSPPRVNNEQVTYQVSAMALAGAGIVAPSAGHTAVPVQMKEGTFMNAATGMVNQTAQSQAYASQQAMSMLRQNAHVQQTVQQIITPANAAGLNTVQAVNYPAPDASTLSDRQIVVSNLPNCNERSLSDFWNGAIFTGTKNDLRAVPIGLTPVHKVTNYRFESMKK